MVYIFSASFKQDVPEYLKAWSCACREEGHGYLVFAGGAGSGRYLQNLHKLFRLDTLYNLRISLKLLRDVDE